MAKIHGISGCTQYLFNGIYAINGKQPTNLEDIDHFYKNYDEILAETELTITNQLDEKILRLSNDEIRLNSQIQEGIAQRTVEVDSDIHAITTKIETATNIFTKWGNKLRYWIAVSSRSRNINRPFTGPIKELQRVKGKKATTIKKKPDLIKNECTKIAENHTFITNNQSFFIGALGEELVIKVLSQLSDEYHVLNDVNLRFNPPIHWRAMNEYIVTSQIDHIVIGPTGIFLLETKNWKFSDIEKKSDDLVYQVRRSSLALWFYLKKFHPKSRMPKTRNVVVSIQGSYPYQKLDKYIDVIAPDRLCEYITRRDSKLSTDAVKHLVKIISRSR